MAQPVLTWHSPFCMRSACQGVLYVPYLYMLWVRSPAESSSPISTPSNMYNYKLDEAVSPIGHATSIVYSRNHGHLAPGLGTPKSDCQSVGTSANDAIDIAPRPSALNIQSSIRFVLGNFFIAMLLISLIIFVIFFAVTWFILRDVRSLNLQVFSNSTGVSPFQLHHGERTPLMTVVVIVIDPRRRPSAGSRGVRFIHFVECHCLWCGHDPWGSVLGRPCSRQLRTFRRGT